MSYSTWHFIAPFPSSGWLFPNMVLPRFVSMWQEMLRRHMWFDCLDIVTRWVLHQYSILLHHSYRLQYVNCPGHTHAPVTSSLRQRLIVVRSQPRTSSWPSRVSVIRQLSWVAHRFFSSRRPGRARSATRAFYVLAAHEPSASAVLLPRCSHATSVS